MKGNKLLFSRYKADRVKGYRKLLKKQDTSYKPPADIVKDIGEAMEAQGFETSKEEVSAYLRASYAAFDRRYYLDRKK
tara:strand:+ start:6669 stop:6902 length:234 start_codon:yes stop_codon:yes gene_type:complete